MLAAWLVVGGFGDLHFVHAAEALEAGRCRAALDHFEQAGPRQGRMWTEARVVAVRAALSCGDGDLALALLRGLDIPEIPDHLAALRARAGEMTGDWRLAKKAWADVLASGHAGLRVDAQLGMADAHFALGELSEARDLYRSLQRSVYGAQRVTLRFTLGEIAHALGEQDAAAEHWAWVAYANPEHPLSDVAEARLSRADLPSDVTNPLSRVDLYLSAHTVERAREALAAIAPTIHSSEDRAAFDYRRAQLAYREREYAGAIALFQSLLAGAPSSRVRPYQEWLARSYAAAGDYGRAVAMQLEIAGSGGSRQARRAHFKAAWLAYDGGLYDRAIALFAQFRARFPWDSSASDALWYEAWIHYRAGRLDQAKERLAALRTTYPSSDLNVRGHYWTGRIDMQMGHAQLALVALGRAEALDPTGYYGAMARLHIEAHGAQQRADSMAAPVASLQVDRESPGEAQSSAAAWERPSWPEKVLDWTDAAAARVLVLMRVGLEAEAAEEVANLRPLPGSDPLRVDYARARLLYALGDYHGAFDEIASRYETMLSAAPTAENVALFRMAYPYAHAEIVQRATEHSDVPALLVLSVMRQESAYDHRAKSNASAHGLMQIIPRTGRRIAAQLGVSDFEPHMLQNPRINVLFGTWYLERLLANFQGSLPLAIAAYNAGPIAVAKWLERRAGSGTDEFVEDIPYRETRHYVKRVIGNLENYQRLSGRSFKMDMELPAHSLNLIDF
jgi:soluble lytic murein transglycosylase